MGGGRGGDPDQIFNRFSQGKEVIDLNAAPEQFRPVVERILQGYGITPVDGKVTRGQFKTAFEKSRGGAAGGPGGAGPAAVTAESVFRSLDTDGDGQLKGEEMIGT